MAVIQFKTQKEMDYEKIPESDPRKYIKMIITQGLADYGQRPDLIFHVDSDALFSMTSTYIKTPSLCINEIYFIPDLTNHESILSAMKQAVENLTITEEEYKDTKYGEQFKEKLLTFVNHIKVHNNSLRPMYEKIYPITEINKCPFATFIFTEHINEETL